MTKEELEVLKKITEIFFPNAAKEMSKLKNDSALLIHYTSAENALNIIKSQSLWLRNSRTMNDWSEVEHGYKLLRNYLHADDFNKLNKFKSALNGIGKNMGERVINTFDSFLNATFHETYIASLSKLQDDEVLDGRLSMWRAYGSDVLGVAIIFKTPPRGSATPLNIVLNPVAYADDAFIANELNQVIDNIFREAEFLSGLQQDYYMLKLGYMTLLMSAVSLKHPGFKEENEWRLIYSPQQFQSAHVDLKTTSIRGMPQKIYTFNFKNKPESQINGVSFPELFDSIIITESAYNSTIIGALKDELLLAGVDDVDSKIRVSSIPYRKN